MKQKPANLIESIEMSALPNYLGSVETVERLLRDFLNAALNRRSVGHPDYVPEKSNANDMDVAETKRLAEIFLGGSPDYPAPQPWNYPGGVDAFIGEQLNIDESDPIIRLQTALLKLLTAFYQMIQAPPEKHWEIDAIIEQWRNWLLGIPPEVLR